MSLDEDRARALLLDMQRRVADGPHVTLDVPMHATAADIRGAWLKLTKRFHPARFGRMAPEIQKLANEVFLSIKNAHETLAKPQATRAKSTTVVPTSRPMTRPLGVPITPSGPIPSRSSRPSEPPPRPTPNPPLGRPSARPHTPPFGRPAATTPRPQTPPHGVRVAPNPAATTQPIRRVGTTPPPVRTPVGSAPHQQTPTDSRFGTPISATARPSTPPATTRPSTPPTTTRPSTPPPRPSTSRNLGPAQGGQVTDSDPALGPILDLVTREQWDQAERAIDALAKQNPNSRRYQSMALYTRGRRAQIEGRVNDARIELQQASMIDPTFDLPKTALGELFTRRK